MQKQAVVVNIRDNVATAVTNLRAEQNVSFFLGQDVEELKISEDIPVGHKFAIKDIDVNQEVIKYGEVIGSTLSKIKKGQYVHVHNMQSNRGRGDIK